MIFLLSEDEISFEYFRVFSWTIVSLGKIFEIKSTYLLWLSHLYIQIESSERVKSFVFCTRKLLAAKSLPQSMKLRNEETFPIFRIASVMQTTNEIQRSRVFFNSITIQLNFLNFETICKNSRLLQESIWIFNILAWYELNYKSQFFR